MWDVSIALILNLLAMAAIGIGPSLYLLSKKNCGTAALGIAPAVGFVVTSLIGTYLTLLDCPVARGCTLILIVGMVASIVLSSVAILARGNRNFMVRREVLLPLGGFLLISVLAMAPQILGGLRYSILRGNGTDSFNYVTAAGYLDHEPYSWAFHADVSSLEERHPSYERARQLLTTRWSTFMMLALTARIGGAAAYRFEYFFSVLCFLLAFGPVYLFCRQLLSLRASLATGAAIAICGGFWAQIILDTRADSQLNSIPVVLLLAFLIARLETENEERFWWHGSILIGAAGASLFLLYPEILPMVVLSVGLFFALSFRHGKGSGRMVAALGLSTCLALIAIVPTWRLLWAFGRSQMHIAATFKNHWEQAYYPWLYSSPFSGIWGFGPFAAPGERLRVPAILLGLVLTVVLVVFFVRVLIRPVAPGGILAAAFAGSALLQWAYLCIRGQLWAGAKGLSFGYPFLILSVLACAFTFSETKLRNWRLFCQRLSQTAVIAMLLIQLGLAFSRPILAWRGQEYPNYIASHGEYRRHDWNVAPFASVLKLHPGATVWSDLSNPWVADYLGLVFGWDVHLVNIGTSRDKEEFKVPPPSLQPPPEYIFVERGALPSGLQVAHNTELALLKTSGSTLPVTEIQNANGLEGTPQQPFFWLGTKPAELSVFSVTNGTALLSGRFTIGPSTAPNLRTIHMTVTSGAGVPQQFSFVAGQQQFPVRTVVGLNRVTLQVNDPAVRLLPADPRPLLVRVDGLYLERQDCQAVVSR